MYLRCRNDDRICWDTNLLFVSIKRVKFLLEQRVIAGDYQKWIAKLLGYDFVIEYKRGLENKAADARSRLPAAMELGQLSVMAGLNANVFDAQVSLDD